MAKAKSPIPMPIAIAIAIAIPIPIPMPIPMPIAMPIPMPIAMPITMPIPNPHPRLHRKPPPHCHAHLAAGGEDARHAQRNAARVQNSSLLARSCLLNSILPRSACPVVPPRYLPSVLPERSVAHPPLSSCPLNLFPPLSPDDGRANDANCRKTTPDPRTKPPSKGPVKRLPGSVVSSGATCCKLLEACIESTASRFRRVALCQRTGGSQLASPR
ncbi:hypothetical protein PMIN04_009568 [Paraphaeosphaeria minitans]